MVKKLSNYFLKNNEVYIPLWTEVNLITRKMTNNSLSSKQHCFISIKGDLILLEDNSTNGTFVNNSFIHKESIIIKINDEIGFGSSKNKFCLKKYDSQEIIKID